MSTISRMDAALARPGPVVQVLLAEGKNIEAELAVVRQHLAKANDGFKALYEQAHAAAGFSDSNEMTVEMEISAAIGMLARQRDELLEVLDMMVRLTVHTGRVDRDYNGQVAGTFVTDSGAISTHAEALRALANHGRFRIVAECGRMVVGYWPHNDPQAATAPKGGAS